MKIIKLETFPDYYLATVSYTVVLNTNAKYGQDNLFQSELNKLYGYKDGLVPFDTKGDPQHLEAAYRLGRITEITIYLTLKIDKRGNLSIMDIKTQ